MQSNGNSNQQAIPEVPKVPKTAERMMINEQCADIEDWDDKAFPLMIERAVPDAYTPLFTTLSVTSADLLVALLTKRMTLVTPAGVVEFDPIVEDNPDLAPLITWLKAASASVKSRRSRRP